MAPGLNGRQTGTVPKSKSKNSGSQSQRLPREPFSQLSLLDWEHMSDLGNKSHSRNRGSTPRCEAEADSIRHELGRSRSSTVTSQNENGEGCSEDGLSNRLNLPERKQVVSKLSQIQSYVQQTAALMNTLKSSDSPAARNQYEKLSVMLEELKDSERKLSTLLNKMDCTESRIDSLLMDVEELQGNNNADPGEAELGRRSEESKQKLEILQKRKQLQEKAKKQLQEAQAEQSRLVARASSLNQELNINKIMDLNVQQLSQRLKAVQQIYNTRNQINDSLTESRRTNRDEGKRAEEDQAEMSDTETDLQLVADKMQELNAMKAQLGQIQKIMASISGIQNVAEVAPCLGESGEDLVEHVSHNSQNSCCADGERNGEDGNNNVMKLEQAKSKLNHLTHLLEVVQSAQNTAGLSPSYLQLVSNLVNEEADSSTHSASPAESVKSLQRNCDNITIQNMQVMTRELEETTAAMKDERDRLLASRQELQDIAKRLPLNKSEPERFSPDEDSESEPPCLKPATLDSNSRDVLNGLTEAEESPNCDEGIPYVSRPVQSRSRQRGIWNSSLPGSNYATQERRSKNESLSRGSNQSSRGNSRALGRDQSRWSPSPSVSYCNDRTNPLAETQNQLEISGNLCEMMLSESLQRGIRPHDISLQEMFSQHQMLTKTVAQCSQLLWLQQKQIIELRNAIMLQCGPFPNVQFQHAVSTQPPLNVPATNNPPYSGLSMGLPFSNVGHVPSVPIQQHQNFLHPANQNVKLNAGEIHNVQVPHQEFPDQFLHQGNQTSSMHFSAPEVFGCDRRVGNFNRFNPSGTPNTNQNTYQNVTSGSNNRGPSGANSVVPEDSGALNNQVPPGNRANNYWDNFRSYSRQNLLSNTKSNEDTDISRRSLISSAQERPPRDAPVAHCSQNNHSAAAAATTQQPSLNCGSLESTLNAQHLLPPSQNTRIAHHGQVTRSRSVEPQSQRNPGKNESRHQDNDSRNFNVLGKNDGWGGARTRNPDSGSEMIRNVRNDVSQGPRNTDNINSEESAQGNNKKRLERTRCRNDGPGNLNNRGYYNTSLWENIYSEVSNFIRANEGRPHFLLQLFRDLQQATTDNLRQRTLVAVQETVAANNLAERTSNVGGGNLNIIENRNNIRENRSNLNRNQTEDPSRIDELFCHLRENQNTIRQNIGMSSHVSGGNNLENPNISNIRDLGNSRNNLENEGLRDLRTYFEASLCNFGHNSALENPNLSNIRENLTRRPPGASDFENVHQKNVYLSIHDNVAVEGRRRNQESSGGPDFGAPCRNFEPGNDYAGSGFHGNCESIRASGNHFEVENNFEGGAVGGRGHFQQENRPSTSRFPALDAGDSFPRPRQFLSNGNDSGIDINYDNDERRGFLEGEGVGDSGSVKPKKSDGAGDAEGAAALVLPQWERNAARDASFDSSSLGLSRNDATSPFVPICVGSFFGCRTFRHSDNGDLAEADQSRNDETSAAESDSGFIGVQISDPGMGFCCDQNLHSSETDFSSRNVPEAERNFPDAKKVEDDEGSPTGAAASEAEGSSALTDSASRSEGNLARVGDASDKPRKNEPSEGPYYQVNASTGSENAVAHRKRREETAERECSADAKTTSGKNSTNKFRDCAFAQEKFEGSDEYENRKTDSDSATSGPDGRRRTESGDSWYYGAFRPVLDASAEGEKGDEADGRQRTESGDSWYYGAFRPVLDKSGEEEMRNTSPEAESDWECGSGLDQVPTRLKKRGSSRKSEDSGDSGA